MKIAWFTASAAALFLSACTSTYSGRVVSRDGTPLGGARVQAIGGRSLFSKTPFDWSPGAYIRGSVTSSADGTFRLQASAWRISRLEVESETGKGEAIRPARGRTVTIMVKPEEQPTPQTNQNLSSE